MPQRSACSQSRPLATEATGDKKYAATGKSAKISIREEGFYVVYCRGDFTLDIPDTIFLKNKRINIVTIDLFETPPSQRTPNIWTITKEDLIKEVGKYPHVSTFFLSMACNHCSNPALPGYRLRKGLHLPTVC